MMLEQKAPVFPQQYASQAQMAPGSYAPMQDPNFHTMGQRPSYATLRMQPRPGLRPTGLVQNQPNQLRLQLQHRLQAQQVCSWPVPGKSGAGGAGMRCRDHWGSFWRPQSHSVLSVRVNAFPRQFYNFMLFSALPHSLLSFSFPSSVELLSEPQCLYLGNGLVVQSRLTCLCLWAQHNLWPKAPRTRVVPAISPAL